MRLDRTPLIDADVANKGYVDALVNGLSWKTSVNVVYYIGTRTIAQIDALAPSAGWAVVAGSAGTPAAGTSDALAIGDIAEYSGTSWKLITANVGGFPPDGARAVIAWPASATLYGPLTDGADEGRIAQWDGTSLTPATYTNPSDGWALLCKGAQTNPPTAFNENKGFAYGGAVPNGSWNQVAGPTPYGTSVAAVGTANSPGVSADVARVDHVHDSAVPLSGTDKARAPLATTGANFQTTGLTITGSPALAGDIQVIVNGLKVVLGNGNRLNLGSFANNVECYFSLDGGATALTIATVTAGATLYWNAVNAGYDLAVTDSVDMIYETF
jgi:hypothetical protein